MAFDIHLREKSSFLLNILHILDCLLVVAMLWVLAKIHKVPWSEAYSYLALVSFILSFASFFSVKLYRPWRGIKLIKELFVILKAWLVFSSTLLSLFFFFQISYSIFQGGHYLLVSGGPLRHFLCSHVDEKNAWPPA